MLSYILNNSLVIALVVLIVLFGAIYIIMEKPKTNTDGFTNKKKKSKQPLKEGFINNSFSNIHESFNMLQSYKQGECDPLIAFIN